MKIELLDFKKSELQFQKRVDDNKMKMKVMVTD